MRIAILVDSLLQKGGVERVLLQQLMAFKGHTVDIIAGRYDSQSTFKEFQSANIFSLIKNKEPGPMARLQLELAFQKLRLKGYDLYILHGGSSLRAARAHRPNIWYCHAPMRWVYDLFGEELSKRKGINKIFYSLACKWLRTRDLQSIKNIDIIISNSKFTAARVKQYFQRDSFVIYPAVDIEKFRWRKNKGYYLSTARLDPIKRVHLAVQAFQRMPEKRLIVMSHGREEERIKKMCLGYPNITFLGEQDETEMRKLLSQSIATLYLSHKEDFGITPVESLAAGKPCIVSNEGGLTETIIDKKTGLLIEPTQIENIIRAVNWLTPERAECMRALCQRRAKLFSLKTFIKKMKAVVSRLTNVEEI
ncbi:MAG: glycosyltransferase [Candidatus Woesearchaeota archaeon]